MAIECARARAPSPHGAVGQPQAEDMADADDPREKLKQIIANWIRCTPIRLSPYRPQGDRGGPWSRLAHLERTSCFHRGSTRSAFALGHAKNSSHSCRRNIALPPPKPRGGRRALAGERSEPVRLAVRNRHRRSLCGKSPAQSEQWYCWIGRRRIISVLAGIIFTLVVAVPPSADLYGMASHGVRSFRRRRSRSERSRPEHRRLGPS